MNRRTCGFACGEVDDDLLGGQVETVGERGDRLGQQHGGSRWCERQPDVGPGQHLRRQLAQALAQLGAEHRADIWPMIPIIGPAECRGLFGQPVGPGLREPPRERVARAWTTSAATPRATAPASRQPSWSRHWAMRSRRRATSGQVHRVGHRTCLLSRTGVKSPISWRARLLGQFVVHRRARACPGAPEPMALNVVPSWENSCPIISG